MSEIESPWDYISIRQFYDLTSKIEKNNFYEISSYVNDILNKKTNDLSPDIFRSNKLSTYQQVSLVPIIIRKDLDIFKVCYKLITKQEVKERALKEIKNISPFNNSKINKFLIIKHSLNRSEPNTTRSLFTEIPEIIPAFIPAIYNNPIRSSNVSENKPKDIQITNECYICTKTYNFEVDSLKLLPCMHVVHSVCLEKLEKQICPLCRKSF